MSSLKQGIQEMLNESMKETVSEIALEYLTADELEVLAKKKRETPVTRGL